jgi:hypothetical protein
LWRAFAIGDGQWHALITLSQVVAVVCLSSFS